MKSKNPTHDGFQSTHRQTLQAIIMGMLYFSVHNRWSLHEGRWTGSEQTFSFLKHLSSTPKRETRFFSRAFHHFCFNAHESIETLSRFAHQFKLSINSFMSENIQRALDSPTKTNIITSKHEFVLTSWIPMHKARTHTHTHSLVHCHCRPLYGFDILIHIFHWIKRELPSTE